MNNLKLTAFLVLAFFLGTIRRAEAQTSQCGPEGTAMVPNGRGALVRVFCDPPVVPPPRPFVAVVPTPPVPAPAPMPPTLRPPPLPPAVVRVIAPPVPAPSLVQSTVVTVSPPPVAARVQPPPAPDLRRPPPPPSVGGLEFFAPQGGARNEVIAVVIGHLWAGTVWADTGPGTASVPLFSRAEEIPRGEDVTVSLNVREISTTQVRIRIMCGGSGGIGGRMLAPRWVRTGTYWALPASECF